MTPCFQEESCTGNISTFSNINPYLGDILPINTAGLKNKTRAVLVWWKLLSDRTVCVLAPAMLRDDGRTAADSPAQPCPARIGSPWMYFYFLLPASRCFSTAIITAKNKLTKKALVEVNTTEKVVFAKKPLGRRGRRGVTQRGPHEVWVSRRWRETGL